MHGFIAWLAWLFVHLFYLIGFRNKMTVLADWIWNYITYDRRVRLIVRPYSRKQDRVPQPPVSFEANTVQTSAK
jgi:NADH dehydrogenase